MKPRMADLYSGAGGAAKGYADAAMGIDWMTQAELSQAIPPAYTQWIGERLIAELRAAA